MNNIIFCDNCGFQFNTVENIEELEELNKERAEEGEEPMEFRPPLILHSCGCTFCGKCITEIIEEGKHQEVEGEENMTPEELEELKNGPKRCPNCQTEIIEVNPDECRSNVKIISFLKDEGAQPLVEGTLETIQCPRHTSKMIDFFCKTCSISVCSKCIYDDHNGHNLMPIKDMSNSLKQNVIDLRKMLDNSFRLIYENQNLLAQVKEELERLMELQLNNIQDGFADL